jgi:hypothetical protein
MELAADVLAGYNHTERQGIVNERCASTYDLVISTSFENRHEKPEPIFKVHELTKLR